MFHVRIFANYRHSAELIPTMYKNTGCIQQKETFQNELTAYNLPHWGELLIKDYVEKGSEKKLGKIGEKNLYKLIIRQYNQTCTQNMTSTKESRFWKTVTTRRIEVNGKV